MNKYEQRVLNLAMEMAYLHKPTLKWTHNPVGIPYTPQQRHNSHMKETNKLIPLARLCVQREAEAVKSGMIGAIFFGLYETNIHKRLEDDGFIPPQTQTTCKGECNSGVPSHTCPYKADINGDNSLCACCDKCTTACSDNR